MGSVQTVLTAMPERAFNRRIAEGRPGAWRQDHVDVRGFVARVESGADQKKAESRELGSVSELAQGAPHLGIVDWSDLLCGDAKQASMHVEFDWRKARGSNAHGRGNFPMTSEPVASAFGAGTMAPPI